MAQTLKLRRSATASAVPTTAQLALGELAINTYDGKLFLKKNVSGTETIVEVGAGTAVAGSSGQIQFNNAGAFGTDSLFVWDATNDRLGIGVASPALPLDLWGTVITNFSPNIYGVQLTGNSAATGGAAGTGIAFRGYYTGTTAATEFAVVSGIKENTTDTNYAGALIFGTRTHGSGVGSTERMRITSTGLVGIGCTPDQTLVVNGIIQSGTTGNNGSLYLGGPNVSLRSAYASNVLGIYINNSEFIRVNTTGIGIGTTNPRCQLEATTAIALTANNAALSGGAYYSGGWKNTVSGQGGWGITNNGGALSIWTAPSPGAVVDAALTMTQRLNIDGNGFASAYINLDWNSGNNLRFGHANQTDANDGKIGAGLFASGLNIVGTQTVAAQGRIIRLYGSVIDSGGGAYAYSGSGATYTFNISGSSTSCTGNAASATSCPNYVPLAGGTMTNTLYVNIPQGFVVHNAATNTPSFMMYNDGTNAYFLLTAAGTSPSNSYNSLRPLYINCTSGLLTSTNGQSLSGGCTIDTLTLTNDLTVANGGTGVSTLTGIVKGNGTAAFSAAVAGTDYMGPTGGQNNVDNYMNVRVIRNTNTTAANDGMYIGYGNSNSGLTRVYGGGSTTVSSNMDATGYWVHSSGTAYVYNSGTWSINVTGSSGSCTGNAATATTATNWGAYGAVPAAGTSFGTANTIGRSDASGYTYFGYINSSTSNNENPTISQIIVTNGSDNFYRKASLASLVSAIGGASGIARAWVRFNGNPATIRGSYNVSSVTFNGTGDFNVNFTNALPTANYAPIGTGDYNGAAHILNNSVTALPTTTTCRFGSYNASFGAANPAYVSIAFIC